jgi:hypothetical protein
MGRRPIDLSRDVSHMTPAPNPHVDQVPALWDRITHEGQKGKFAHADITFPIRDCLIGEPVGAHLDALSSN